MAAETPEGDLAVKVLDEYMQDFQRRNPTLRVFCCYLHQDEATPHLHIDFVPYVTGWKGKGMDTRVSLKQALKSLGFQGGAKHDTELNQWINHEKEVLAEIMERYEIEWEQKGTHEEHLEVYNFKKKERAKEVKELEQKIENLAADVEAAESDIKALNQEKADAEKARDQVRESKEQAEKEFKHMEKQRNQLQSIINNINKELKNSGQIKLVLPEAGALELASTYRNKKIKPLFAKIKNYVAGLVAKVIELSREAEKWRDKYQQLKKDYDDLEKDADKVADLCNLDNGADLQHQINLDDSLIFEASPTDKVLCMNYFKELINNRLDYYFDNPQINFHLLFNNDANFEKLVLASMGNTRDFGTMLLKCWSEFQSYRNSPLVQGRPFKYISLQMVTSAIKDNGDKKISNLNSNENTLSVWNDILNFCLSKKSSHFAINESQTELECLRKQEFSDLIYHRLLHFRKAHVPTKDGVLTDKLSIYAINYACSYNLHSESKISFITEYKTIHDRVRRYIYHPSAILQKLQIKEGEIFPCSNCGEPINILKMKAAWDNNACPFCGQHIRH